MTDAITDGLLELYLRAFLDVEARTWLAASFIDVDDLSDDDMALLKRARAGAGEKIIECVREFRVVLNELGRGRTPSSAPDDARSVSGFTKTPDERRERVLRYFEQHPPVTVMSQSFTVPNTSLADIAAKAPPFDDLNDPTED